MNSNKNRSHYNTFVNENETMTEFIVKQGNFSLIKQLISKNIIDIDEDYNYLIDLAIKHKQFLIIKDIAKLVIDENNNKLEIKTKEFEKYKKNAQKMIVFKDEEQLTCQSVLSNITCFTFWIMLLFFGYRFI
jgi:hypothetical protein